MLNECSNIGSQINHFVEQNAGPAQHALDLVGSFRNRTPRGIERQFACLGRLVILADSGERGERASARLGVVALGIAALADFGRCRDVNLAECGLRNAARGGAVFARGRHRGDDRDVPVARQMGRDFGEPADVLAAILFGESKIAV